MKATILANGAFPTLCSLLDELKESKFLAVCDGAINHLESLHIEPSVIVGDLDSISEDLKKRYAQKLVHIKEQESNDLSKAFFYCVALGYDEFVILGATGKREDHSMANISLLYKYIHHCKKVCIKSDFGIFSIHKTPCKIPSKKGEQVSIFALSPSTLLTSKGLKYPLKNLSLPLWANGTLNEALEDHFILSSQNDGELIIVYQAFTP